MKTYSKLDSLPTGKAKEIITPGCLVLEGGAFRGVYTSGVLDYLMEHDLNIETTIGNSAGAMNGILYTSGDIGRAARTNLGHRHDSNYVGLKAIKHEHSLIGFNYCFNTLSDELPIDLERLKSNKRRFLAVATSLTSGKLVYFENNKCDDIFKAVQASASMPFVSKPIQIGNDLYLDGGCSTKIPYQWAFDNNFKKIVVVLTREKGYKKKETSNEKLIKQIYHKYPEFQKSLLMMNKEANREKDELEELAKEGKIFLLEPSLPVTVSRLERDMEKLGDLYYLGYNDCKNRFEELKKYLLQN